MNGRPPPEPGEIVEVADQLMQGRGIVLYRQVESAVRRKFNTNTRLAYRWIHDVATSEDPPFLIGQVRVGKISALMTRSHRYEWDRDDIYQYVNAYCAGDQILDPMPWIDQDGNVTSALLGNPSKGTKFVLRHETLAAMKERGARDAATMDAAATARKNAQVVRAETRYGESLAVLRGLVAAAGLTGFDPIDISDFQASAWHQTTVTLKLVDDDIARLGTYLTGLGVPSAPRDTEPPA